MEPSIPKIPFRLRRKVPRTKVLKMPYKRPLPLLVVPAPKSHTHRKSTPILNNSFVITGPSTSTFLQSSMILPRLANLSISPVHTYRKKYRFPVVHKQLRLEGLCLNSKSVKLGARKPRIYAINRSM